MLTFDQAAFFAGLHMLTGVAVGVLVGGWFAKMAAVALYTVLAGSTWCISSGRSDGALTLRASGMSSIR